MQQDSSLIHNSSEEDVFTQVGEICEKKKTIKCALFQEHSPGVTFDIDKFLNDQVKKKCNYYNFDFSECTPETGNFEWTRLPR